MKALRLILTFYRSFAFAGFLITLACVNIIYMNGIESFTPVFWFKIFTVVLIYYYINGYKKNELYYYKNLGISKLKLWLPTLIFDFLTFLFLTILVGINIHEAHPGS